MTKEFFSTVAVVGLGYVGLPLVVEFGKKLRTIGFDIVEDKVNKCRAGTDPSREIPDADMRLAVHAEYSSDPAILRDADFILVAVPTPVDQARIPDFGPLIAASKGIGPHLKKGAIVVYESTVYPGATEEVCIPVLESTSGLTRRTALRTREGLRSRSSRCSRARISGKTILCGSKTSTGVEGPCRDMAAYD